MELTIDSDRLQRELDTLAGFSAADGAPAVTRIVFSKQDQEARAWLKGVFGEAGLAVREDAVGNTFARWIGAGAGLAAVGTGSHIDAIPSSGRFDGTLGVLGGLEAIRTLRRSGYRPRRSIELLLFTSEEPTRFGIGCLGSRLLSGSLTGERTAPLRDVEGRSLDELRRDAGFSGELAGVVLAKHYYSAFVELHIEQGPRLEREQIAIGAVTNIAAPASLRILVEGEGGHAGTVLMPDRKDALLGAAEIALAVEKVALATGCLDTVGTTGICDVFPGAVNSIPSRVRLEIDTRDTDLARRDGVVRRIEQVAAEIGAKRGLQVSVEVVNADAPAQCDSKILDAIAKACAQERLSVRRLVSRAYHDTLFMSRIAPVAMIFIPCRGGVSHRPDEYSSPEQIRDGVAVLARTLGELAA